MIINLEDMAEVTVIDDERIRFEDHVYDIVSPTEKLYPDIQYLSWDGALWAKE